MVSGGGGGGGWIKGFFLAVMTLDGSTDFFRRFAVPFSSGASVIVEEEDPSLVDRFCFCVAREDLPAEAALVRVAMAAVAEELDLLRDGASCLVADEHSASSCEAARAAAAATATGGAMAVFLFRS